MPADGKAPDPLVDFVARVLIEHARLLAEDGLEASTIRSPDDVRHRSTSPNTMSCVPITATTSASMWPLVISSSADRCTKPGARTLSRYGLLAPSEIRYTPSSPLGPSTAA